MTKSEKKINVKEHVDDITIDLSLCEISEIPVKEISAIKRATILDLSSNKITTLGKHFGALSHLTKLDLSRNQIKFLSPDIGKLIFLKHFDLYNNKLEHLPIEFGHLKSLRYLDLKGNPLTPSLAKIIGPCLTLKDCQNAAKIIVRFLSEMQVRVAEEKEKQRIEQVKQAAIEADILEKQQKEAASAAAISLEQSKSNKKREKRKEKKLKAELDAKNNETNSLTGKSSSGPVSGGNCIALFSKCLFLSIFVWFIFLLFVGIVFVKYPIKCEAFLLEHIPNSYKPFVNNTFELITKIINDIREYYKF